MIRIVTGLFAFAVALCALIILRPYAEREIAAAERQALLAEAEVTRLPGMSMTVAETEAARAAMIAYRESLPQADEMRAAPVVAAAPVAGREAAPTTFGIGTGRPTAADMALAAAHGQVIAVAAPAIRTDQSSLSETTAAVLSGLGLDTGAAAPDPLRDMTAGALSGIAAVTGAEVSAAPRTALQALVVDALAAGQSDAYIDALLNEAALAGEITVPAILVTADGRVDTAVLLSSIVADARLAATGEAPVAPAAVGGEGVEVRVVQTATATESFRFYTVSQGDSLGAIAVKFYGDVRWYELIFEANRDLLSSPDQIMVGQRLVIPELPVT
jgi:nucleoid-associated protein YgaU